MRSCQEKAWHEREYFCDSFTDMFLLQTKCPAMGKEALIKVPAGFILCMIQAQLCNDLIHELCKDCLYCKERVQE